MLSIHEFAEKLNVHPNTVRRWISTGKIKALKIGKNWKISVDELNRVLKEGIQL